MEKKVDTKFTWVIKNFSSLQSKKIFSDKFVVGVCKWHLIAYPKGDDNDKFLSLYLGAADCGSLPSGWRRHIKYRLIVVNQRSEKLSRQLEATDTWFDEKYQSWGFRSMLLLSEIYDKDSGFLENGELKVAVEIDILEIIGKVDVNGFQLLPPQVEFVSRMFEKHSEITSEFRPKNPNIRTGYMNLLLSVIDSLLQSPHKLLRDDLDEAYDALECLNHAGFKLDWLAKKLDQVAETKEKEKASEILMQETEKELKNLKQKCSDLEAQVEKEKAEVLAAKTPLSFDDVI